MTTIAVLVPVLGRPARVRPLVESLGASARFTAVGSLFLMSPGDTEEIAAVAEMQGGGFAVRASVMEWEAGPGDYARKINWGFAFAVEVMEAEFVFLAADDLVFHPGWAERALACHMETRACVVGTNDGGNREVMAGLHSTHTLVHRDYGGCGTADEPESGKVLCDLYSHNFVDTEFVATARWRQTWAHAGDCRVEHLHHLWGKSDDDATYQLGRRTFNQDQALFRSRKKLWSGR